MARIGDARSVVARAAVVALLPLLIACNPCDRIKSDDPFAEARCRIDRLMTKEDIASFQVAVAKDGSIIYEEAFGLANVDENIPTTTETMHQVASIAKPFRSTALMVLSERGDIDLHRPINDYLGASKLVAYEGDASEATVIRMMLHTTGLPYGYYIAGDEWPEEERRKPSDLVELAGVLATPPGAIFEYSNIGYSLLGDVIRTATGKSVKEVIRDEVVNALGLEHTGYFQTPPQPDVIATQNMEDRVLPVVFDHDGYSALYSTAGDLARFGMFHLKAHLPEQQPILSDSSIDKLWQYQEPGAKFTTRRLAWDVQQDFGFETVQHGGGGPGIHNWLYMIPSENVVIALLSNARYNSSDDVLVALIAGALSESDENTFRRNAGRGWARWPQYDPATWSGAWRGEIKGPKGTTTVAVGFNSRGSPRLRIEADSCSGGDWVSASRGVRRVYGALLWRFDACIPYVYPYATHDEVILSVRPFDGRLVGSVAAANEKDFGRDENYVLPQYVALERLNEEMSDVE